MPVGGRSAAATAFFPVDGTTIRARSSPGLAELCQTVKAQPHPRQEAARDVVDSDPGKRLIHAGCRSFPDAEPILGIAPGFRHRRPQAQIGEQRERTPGAGWHGRATRRGPGEPEWPCQAVFSDVAAASLRAHTERSASTVNKTAFTCLPRSRARIRRLPTHRSTNLLIQDGKQRVTPALSGISPRRFA
jgi:hypothetical protein